MSLIDPELIQRYYSQLSNEELIQFTKKEGNKITDEAADFLYDEFVKRGLDTIVLHKVIEKKNEEKAVVEKQISNWNFAVDARKHGKADADILTELINRQLSEKEADLIIKRLPDTHYENEQFEQLISDKCQSSSLGAVFGMVLAFGLCIYFIYLGIEKHFFLPIVLGLGLALIFIYIIRKNDGDFKGGEFWVELIKTNPENIVWIKPVITKHTIGIVFTLYKTQKFQLLTNDGQKVLMTIDTEEERRIFFEGVIHLLPHAHIGFTYEIDALYYASPENFINTVQTRQLYRPIDTFDVAETEAHSAVNRHKH